MSGQESNKLVKKQYVDDKIQELENKLLHSIHDAEQKFRKALEDQSRSSNEQRQMYETMIESFKELVSGISSSKGSNIQSARQVQHQTNNLHQSVNRSNADRNVRDLSSALRDIGSRLRRLEDSRRY